MSDTLALALVVIALYLSECVVFARHGAVVFTAPFFLGRPRARLLSRALGTARGAFTLLNPLPPFGRVYVSEPWPFSASEDGVVALRSFALGLEPRPLQSAERLAWQDIEKIRVDESAIVVNGKTFAHASSPRHARAAAKVLEALQATDARKRPALLDELVRAHLDPAPVRTALTRHLRWGAAAMVSSSFVFLALFGVVPRVMFTAGLAHWPLLVALVYAGVVLAVVTTWIAHRVLLPDARGDRWLQTLLMLPAPTMAMRGNDKLGRALLAGSHPLAVALAAMKGEARDDVVGRGLRDLSHPRRPVMPSADDGAARIEAAFRARLLAHAKAIAAAEGVDVDACLKAPVLRAGQTSFCPRCRIPYRVDAKGSVCNDCGVPLQAVQTP